MWSFFVATENCDTNHRCSSIDFPALRDFQLWFRRFFRKNRNAAPLPGRNSGETASQRPPRCSRRNFTPQMCHPKGGRIALHVVPTIWRNINKAESKGCMCIYKVQRVRERERKRERERCFTPYLILFKSKHNHIPRILVCVCVCIYI